MQLTSFSMLDQESMMEMLEDQFVFGWSSCCTSRVMIPDICWKCKEHCEIVDEDGILI